MLLARFTCNFEVRVIVEIAGKSQIKFFPLAIRFVKELVGF